MNREQFYVSFNQMITEKERAFVESFFSSELERQQFFEWAFGDKDAPYISLRRRWNDLHGNQLYLADPLIDDGDADVDSEAPDFRKEFQDMLCIWLASTLPPKALKRKGKKYGSTALS